MTVTKSYTYKELYPQFDVDDFKLPGEKSQEVSTATLRTRRKAIKKKGTSCPCCGRHVELYGRTIYNSMAQCLVWLCHEYHFNGGRWIILKDGPTFLGGDNAKLKHWFVMVQHETKAGLWRPTQVGIDFVARHQAIPKFVYLYDNKILGYSTEKVTIVDCLQNDFDLNTLDISYWDGYGGPI